MTNKGRKSWIWMGGMVFLGLAACRATLAGDPNKPIKIEAHVTIDVRQIKEEAHSIEEMVSGGAPRKGQSPHSELTDWLAPVAWAEGLSPEAQAAIHSRRDRFGRMKAAKGQGWVGEDKEGHAAALGGGSEVQQLVEQENRDRETIYQFQLKEKNLPADAIGTIRSAFAQEQRERAEPGEKIQSPSGEWTTK